MTTNPYAEAVEAAARAIGSRAACEHERAWIDAPARRYENCFDCDGRAAVAAAVGPLLAPLRAALESLPIQEDFQDDDGNTRYFLTAYGVTNAGIFEGHDPDDTDAEDRFACIVDDAPQYEPLYRGQEDILRFLLGDKFYVELDKKARALAK